MCILKLIKRSPYINIRSFICSCSLAALSEAAARPEWSSLEEVDVPLRQRPLSHCVDDATYNHLLTSAPDTRSRALAVSTALPHASDWLNVTPSPTLGLHLQDREFRLCMDYWLGLCMTMGPCPICGSIGQTLLVTTKSVAGGIETGFTDMIPFGMHSFQ